MIHHKISYKLWATHKRKDIFLFKIQNKNGSFVELTNYGGTIVSIVVPDASGQLGNVILGFDSFEGYLEDDCYIGSTIGRFANRISNARFDLDGEEFVLEKNDGHNTNHGGVHGFHSRIFDFSIVKDELQFKLTSKDGEGGYPGNLEFTVGYSFTEDDQLLINYAAETDRKTFVNFTNHAYFNFNQEQKGILDHQLKIPSNEILELSENHVPTGRIVPSGTITFDGQKIENCLDHAGLRGLNTFYLFDKTKQDDQAVVLSHAGSGRRLEINTSYPGLMLYTGDHLNSVRPGHLSASYKPFDGLCLECQSFPDSPNHTHFPSTMLSPGEKFEQYIHFKFNTY